VHLLSDGVHLLGGEVHLLSGGVHLLCGGTCIALSSGRGLLWIGKVHL